LYAWFANPLAGPYPLLVHPTQVDYEGDQVHLQEKVGPLFVHMLANPLVDPYTLIVHPTQVEYEGD
jgi:hypothetical protein